MKLYIVNIYILLNYILDNLYIYIINKVEYYDR